MKKLILLLLLFGIFFATSIRAETVLYCQTELVTGFIKKNGVWKSANFHNERHTVKFNHDYSRLEGMTTKPMECTTSYSFFPERIFCVHTWGSHETFLFNKETNRFTFTKVSTAGYTLNDSDEDTDTDTFLAGTCKVF